MNIKSVLETTEEFFKKHNISQPRLDAEVLLADLLQIERIKLYVNYDYPLKKKELQQYRERIIKRAQRVPVAYITGNKEFMSLELEVNRNVLLPRPETELLVEEIIEYCQKSGIKDPNIVDVGTGSGAIMVSLGYHLPEAKILGIDISSKALEVARKNIKKYDLEKRLKVIKGDLLKPLIKLNKKNVDIIVSNPPYIKSSEISKLAPEIKSEPRLALDGGDKGIDIYKRLIPEAKKVLNKKGLIFLEIGAEQAQFLKDLLKHWKNVKIKKDYAEYDRIVIATREAEKRN